MPPAGAVPWAGTVSHHLLTDALLERWFAELARRRGVSVFYVLSPSHWGLSSLPWSLTDGTWHVPGGDVESDRPRAAALARRLGVPFEHSVFEGEHGISTLMPYIARHFPGAKVVAMAYRGEPPLDQPMALRLARALAPAFARKGRSGNFLLISTDFAHHGDAAGTSLKDGRSRRFFAAPSLDTWIFAGCDNRPGIYALARMAGPATRCSVLHHTDSLKLSGRDPDDITSYFFTWFWEAVP
jgi:MEMO1 family protein